MLLIIALLEASRPLIMKNEDHLDHSEHGQGGQDRTSAVTDERECDTGQRDKLGLAADRQKGLENIADRSPVGKELEKAVGVGSGEDQDPDKAVDAQKEQTHCKDKSHLLRDRRENKIRFHVGDTGRSALCKAGAPEAAVADGEQGLGNLVSHPIDDRKGIPPDPNADLHMIEQEITDD